MLSSALRSRPTLHELQMLRAIAAVMVVIDHATAQVVDWPGSPSWIAECGWFLGEQGVAIFFIISGFIMSHTTSGHGSVAGAVDFIRRRLRRVVPLYWIFTLLAAALIASGLWLKGRSIGGNELGLSLLFVPYGDSPMRPVLGQGWTLEYEMMFYGVFAVSMLFSRTIGFIFLSTTLLVLVVSGWLIFGNQTGDAASSPIAYLLSPYLLLFLTGIIAGHFRLHIRSSGPVMMVALILVIQIGLYLYILPDFTSLSWRAFFWFVDFIIVLICLNGLSGDNTRPPLAIFETLGAASYSLYLAHIFLVYAVARVWRMTVGEVWPWLYIAAAVVISCAASVVIFRYLERPLYRARAT